MNEIKYKLVAPLGNIIVPKEIMNEQEVREFAAQLVQEAAESDVWKEKVAKDSIESIVEWLQSIGYKVEKL